MSDKPILFSAPMVRALLAGTKTQTRRGNHLERLRRFGPITEFGRSDTNGYDWHFRDKGMRWHDLRHAELLNALPWQKGERLWVRESIERANGEAVGYPADGSWLPNDPWQWQRDTLPSIHMPRRFSRLTLTVTDVRVERLQGINSADALAEGISSTEHWRPKDVQDRPFEEKWWDDFTFWSEYPQIAYRELWDKINGPGAWDANPWVAAYTFTVGLHNIDTPNVRQIGDE